MRLEPSTGLSAELTAAIAVARGEIIIVVGPNRPIAKIPHLIAALSRGDLAIGRRRQTPLADAWQRVKRMPGSLLPGSRVGDLDELFWAAWREAVVGLEMTRGMARYLPTLVAARGFEVCEMPFDCQDETSKGSEGWAHPGDLLATWWLSRRHRKLASNEIDTDRAHTLKPTAHARLRWADHIGRQAHEHVRRRDIAYAVRRPRTRTSNYEDLLLRGRTERRPARGQFDS
jgi:hypothetical protein